MRRLILLASLGVACGACDEGDLHRIAGIPQGTLVVGLGMPMSDVARRSTVKLHKFPTLGLPNGNYGDGNAYFDFELAGSSVRFHGCSMYSINYEGQGEIVKSMSVFITPKSLRWRAFQQELRDTAGKLKADGWEPYQHDGWPTLEAFLSLKGSEIETTPSDVVATFDWKKGKDLFRLSAHRSWSGPDFWSSFELYPADLYDPAKYAFWWPAEFPPYPGARGLCSRNTPQIVERKPGEPTWSMFGTRDEPADVIAFYAAERGLKPEPGATSLSLESKDGRKHLAVHPIGGSYKEDCGVQPESWPRTILIASEAPTQTDVDHEDWLSEFPSYPAASKVCSGHVLGNAGGKRREIEFSLYATKHEPTTVVGFYASARSIKVERGATSLTLRSTDEKRTLSVQAVSGSYPDCGVKPPKDAKAVVVVSQMTP